MLQNGQEANSCLSLVESLVARLQTRMKSAAAQAQEPITSAALQNPALPESIGESAENPPAHLSHPSQPLSLAAPLAAWRRRDWPQAVALLRGILLHQPWRIDAAGMLAGVLLAMGRMQAARQLLRHFTLDYPNSADAWRLAGLLEWKLGQRSEAIALLNRGLRELPLSGTLNRQLAVFLGAAGELPQAATYAENAPRQSVPHIAGDFVAAAIDPLDDYLSAACGTLRNVGRLFRHQTVVRPMTIGQSSSDYVDRLIGDPGLIDSVCMAACISGPADGIERQLLLEIEWRLSRLCELQPRHADRHLALAKIQWRLGATTAAMLSLQRALRGNSRLVEAHRLRARLQAELGDIDAAIQTLQSLIARRLAWPDIHYDIAALQQQRGNAPAAQTHLRSALRINPSFSAARQLLDRSAQQSGGQSPIAHAA